MRKKGALEKKKKIDIEREREREVGAGHSVTNCLSSSVNAMNALNFAAIIVHSQPLFFVLFCFYK